MKSRKEHRSSLRTSIILSYYLHLIRCWLAALYALLLPLRSSLTLLNTARIHQFNLFLELSNYCINAALKEHVWLNKSWHMPHITSEIWKWGHYLQYLYGTLHLKAYDNRVLIILKQVKAFIFLYCALRTHCWIFFSFLLFLNNHSSLSGQENISKLVLWCLR